MNIKYRQYQHMRSVACLSVVSQPMLAYFYNNLPMSPELQGIWFVMMTFVKFSATVFIFYIGITVFTTTESYSQRIKYVWKAYLHPTLIWSGIYLLLKIGQGQTLKEYFKIYFLGDLTPHLWYAVLMLQFQFLYPLLLKIVKPMVSSLQKAVAFSFGLMALYFFINYQGFKLFSISSLEIVRLFDRSFFIFFVYFALGIVFDVYHHRVMPVLVRILPILLMVFSSVLVAAYKGEHHLIELHYFSPVMYLYNLVAIALLVLLCYNTSRKISILGNFLDYLATMCFEVYLANFFVFTVLRTLFSTVLETLHPMSLLFFCYPVTLGLTMLLVSGYQSLWNRFQVEPTKVERLGKLEE